MKKLILISALLFSFNTITAYIAVENQYDPLEEDILISSKAWDETAKILISYGEYDAYLETTVNKNDLSVRTSVVIEAIFPDAFPTFSRMKYVSPQGKPATKDMWSGAYSFEDQYQMKCTLGYRTRYESNPFFTANCQRQRSVSSSFDEEQLNYFSKNGFRIKVSGAADLTINFSNAELDALIGKINDVKPYVDTLNTESKQEKTIRVSEECEGIKTSIQSFRENDIPVPSFLIEYSQSIGCDD